MKEDVPVEYFAEEEKGELDAQHKVQKVADYLGVPIEELLKEDGEEV